MGKFIILLAILGTVLAEAELGKSKSENKLEIIQTAQTGYNSYPAVGHQYAAPNYYPGYGHHVSPHSYAHYQPEYAYSTAAYHGYRPASYPIAHQPHSHYSHPLSYQYHPGHYNNYATYKPALTYAAKPAYPQYHHAPAAYVPKPALEYGVPAVAPALHLNYGGYSKTPQYYG